jgi:hypothetical protein
LRTSFVLRLLSLAFSHATKIPLADLRLVSYSPPPAEVPFAARPAARLRWPERVVFSVTGIVLLVLLALATRLSPNPSGMGTHQQLGLPPCTVVRWFGIRCPSCGMTTAWSHFTRGQMMQAIRASAGGTLLALVAAVGGPWLVASALAGHWLIGPPREVWVFGAAGAIVIVTLGQWAVRISLGW